MTYFLAIEKVHKEMRQKKTHKREREREQTKGNEKPNLAKICNNNKS